MKHAVFFPFYSINSDLVKTAIGLKDTRSIEQFFKGAGIEIHEISKKKCILCEDLLGVTKPKPVIYEYEAQSDISREVDAFE